MAAKTWVDTPTNGTPITADDLNRIENTLSNLTSRITDIENRNGKVLWTGSQNVSSGTSVEIYSSENPFPYTVLMVVGYFSGDSKPGGQDTPYKFFVPCLIDSDNRFAGCATSYGYVGGEQQRLVTLGGEIVLDVSGGQQHASIVFDTDRTFFKLTFNLSGSSVSETLVNSNLSFTLTKVIGVA